MKEKLKLEIPIQEQITLLAPLVRELGSLPSVRTLFQEDHIPYIESGIMNTQSLPRDEDGKTSGICTIVDSSTRDYLLGLHSNITLESLIGILANLCEGKRTQEGLGFNIHDIVTGHRLDALSRNDIMWSDADEDIAKFLVGHYGKMLSGKLSSNKIEKRFLETAMTRYRSIPASFQGKLIEEFQYAYLGPEKRTLNFELHSNQDMSHQLLGVFNHVQHGSRDCTPVFKRDTIPFPVWEVPYCSTTKPISMGLMDLWKQNNTFIQDISIDRPIEIEIDKLFRETMMAFKAESGDQRFAVFDTAEYKTEFIIYMQERFSATTQDGVFRIPLTTNNMGAIKTTLSRFRFHVSEDLMEIINL